MNSRPDESSEGFSITASVSDTKTANDGMYTKWVAEDEISLYHAPAGTSDYTKDNPFKITADNLASNKFIGYLNGTIDLGTSYDWYAVYPYDGSESDPTCIPVTIATTTAVQSQTGGNGSMSKICGTNIPLWGKTTCEGGTSSVNLQMKNLAALLKFKVLNTYFDNDFKLTKIWVSIGDEAIVGNFTVNLTGDQPVFTPVSGETSSSMYVHINETDIVLGNVKSNGVQYAEVYAAIKPFVAPAGTQLRVTVTGEVNGEEKSYEQDVNLSSDVSFNAGKIREINVRTTADPVYICEADVVAMPEWHSGKLYGATFIDEDRLAFSTITDGTFGSNEQIWVYNFKDDSSEKLMDVGTGVYPWKIKYNASDNKLYFISKAYGYVRWVNPDDKTDGYAVKNADDTPAYFGSGRGFMDIEFDNDYNMYVLERDNYTVACFTKSSNYKNESNSEGYFYFGSPEKPRSMCTDGSKLYVATYSDDTSEGIIRYKDLSSSSVGTVSYNSGNVISMMMDAQGRLLWANNSNKIYRTKLNADGTAAESLSAIESSNLYGWPDDGFYPAELVPSPDGKNAFYIIDSAHNRVHKVTIY
ncbi:MAG: hypothetical protein ACI39U_00070 [Candidatus Cryptobacteroides sp.]